MGEYKDYDISTTGAYFDAAYCVRSGDRVIHEGTVHGPFDSLDDARRSAEVAARGWVDRYAK